MTDQAGRGDESTHQRGDESTRQPRDESSQSPGGGKRRPGKHRAGRPGFSRIYGWRIKLSHVKEEGTTDGKRDQVHSGDQEPDQGEDQGGRRSDH